jgi:hypothetical protein
MRSAKRKPKSFTTDILRFQIDELRARAAVVGEDDQLEASGGG